MTGDKLQHAPVATGTDGGGSVTDAPGDHEADSETDIEDLRERHYANVDAQGPQGEAAVGLCALLDALEKSDQSELDSTCHKGSRLMLRGRINMIQMIRIHTERFESQRLAALERVRELEAELSTVTQAWRNQYDDYLDKLTITNEQTARAEAAEQRVAALEAADAEWARRMITAAGTASADDHLFTVAALQKATERIAALEAELTTLRAHLAQRSPAWGQPVPEPHGRDWNEGL